jgi:hypothetical protein
MLRFGISYWVSALHSESPYFTDTTKRGVRGVKGVPKTGWRQADFTDFSIVPTFFLKIPRDFCLKGQQFQCRKQKESSTHKGIFQLNRVTKKLDRNIPVWMCGIIISNLTNWTSSKTQKLCIFLNAQKPSNFAPFCLEHPQKLFCDILEFY